jgi:hypothetical protein
MARGALFLVGVVALAATVAWWVYAGLLMGSDHSPCEGGAEAGVVWGLALVGILLSVAQLRVAVRGGPTRNGWLCLGALSVIAALTLSVVFFCVGD